MVLENRKLLIIGGGAFAEHLIKYKEKQKFKVISVGLEQDPRAIGLSSSTNVTKFIMK